MNYHGVRQCAFGRGAGAVVPLRVLGVLVLLLAIGAAGGCISSQVKGTSSRPVDTKMEIIVQSEIGPRMMDNICIFPFSAPPEMAGASHSLTAAFQARLTQRRPFREATILHHDVKSDDEALWYARSEGYALALRPVLLYMMDGTGAMPTKLDVRTRILDARTGKILWDVKQCALSEPGPDVDLTWNTVVGQPAQRCEVMADDLAVQFAEFLVPPPPAKQGQ
jgi:hypothetical protein